MYEAGQLPQRSESFSSFKHLLKWRETEASEGGEVGVKKMRCWSAE
jgi:hypothetical protein